MAEPGGPAGKWSTRTPVKPDPSKIKVPPGYKVGVFASGLDTITSITVDKNDNVWVAISGNTFGFPPTGIDKPHVKIFDKSGKLIKDNVGLGMFKSFALNEIGYCAENGRTYVGDYSYGIWEIDGVNGTPKLIMNEVPIGDHALGGITCRDGWLYYAVGAPTNSGFSDPNIHGWTDAVDPVLGKAHARGRARAAARPALPGHRADRAQYPRQGQGNLTGAYLPKGTPSKPGQVIKAQKPCGGAIHRAKLKPDSNYTRDDWEVYAMGLRNSSGVAFGPKGSRFENALAVSDNGHNDKGNRRVANAAERLFIFTEKGQDAGFPDKDGINFVNIKRSGPDVYRGNRFDSTRPNPQLYIGDKPFIPTLPPYRFIDHSIGVRGTPLIIANPNPNGYVNPVMEWDTNNPMDGLAWAPKAFGAPPDTIFTAVFGIIDNGPESLRPMWPAIVKIEFLNPTGVKWSIFAENIDPGPNAYQKKENRGGFERTNDVEFSTDGKTMYVADYGELYVNYQMESPFYTTPKSAVVWTITKE